MEILIASISGGNFPYQLGALIELCKTGYRPNVSMGGSGGAVAIYLAAASNWNPAGIERISRDLNRDLFIEDHDPLVGDIVPSFVFNYFRGSMYKSSSKSIELLSKYFTPGRMMENEIWIAAINEGSRGVALFCNTSREKAKIKGSYLARRLHTYEPIRYWSGDIEGITKSILATSAIPMLIEPVNIDDDYYVDCGVSYGSALTPLLNEVSAIARKGAIHMTYLSGYNTQFSKVSENVMSGDANLGDHLKTIPSHFVRGTVQSDRNNAYNILNDICESEPLYKEYSIEELGDVMSFKEKCTGTLIEIYPDSEDSISVFDFNGESVVEFMEQHVCTLRIRMWYCLRPVQ